MTIQTNANFFPDQNFLNVYGSKNIRSQKLTLYKMFSFMQYSSMKTFVLLSFSSFPGQYFGTLYGLLFGVSSIVCLLQFPLFIASQRLFNDDPMVVSKGPMNKMGRVGCWKTEIEWFPFPTKMRKKTRSSRGNAL